MILETEKTILGRNRVKTIICDCCGFFTEDVMEIQEFLTYKDRGGYSSRHIGDMADWTIDLCQDCVYSLLGNYIRKDETNA